MAMDSRSRKPLQRALMSVGDPTSIAYLTESAVVKSDFPDTTFKYNDPAALIHASGDFFDTDIDHRFVWKWNNPLSNDQITYPESTPIYTHSTLALGSGGTTPYYTVVNYAKPEIVEMHIQIDIIKEDFDCSAITWNVLAGLSKAVGYFGVTPITKVLAMRLGKDHPTNPAPTLGFHPFGGTDYVERGNWSVGYNPGYGMVMYFERKQSHREWRADWNFGTTIAQPPVMRGFRWESTRYSV